MRKQIIAGQPSWLLESSTVAAAITQRGAHMGPVTFRLPGERSVQPYHVSPWQYEQHNVPAGRSEAMLRGDFFCLPFGGGPVLDDQEVHVPHGQTAAEGWTFRGESRNGARRDLRISMTTLARPGEVLREFSLVDGQTAIYDRTTILGFAGPVTMGHHAVLALPETEDRMIVSVGPLRLGMTYPQGFGKPESGEYQSLQVGARFENLSQVPSIFVDTAAADCSTYPARAGFSDLLQVAPEPVGKLAWTAAVNLEQQYLWFAIRDVGKLPSTLLWIENRGRHAAPWSGRNVSLGLEDVCSYFDLGIAAGVRANPFSDLGIATHHELKENQPFTVSYVQGVVPVPQDFERVSDVTYSPDQVIFHSDSGLKVSASVYTSFVEGSELPC